MNVIEGNNKVYEFAKVRERYFKHLKKVVNDNCLKCCKMAVSDREVDMLSFNIEQHALLAALQKEIYQKSMNEIICEIRKVTNQDEIYYKIKQELVNLNENHFRISSGTENKHVFYSNHKETGTSCAENYSYEADCEANIENVIPSRLQHQEQCLEPIPKKVLKLKSIPYFRKRKHLSESQYPMLGTRNFVNRTLHEPLDLGNEAHSQEFSSNSHHISKQIMDVNNFNSSSRSDNINDMAIVSKPMSTAFSQVIQKEKERDNVGFTQLHQEHCANLEFNPFDNCNNENGHSEEDGELDNYNDILQILEDEDKSDSEHSFTTKNFVNSNTYCKKITDENNSSIILSNNSKEENFVKSSQRSLFHDSVNRGSQIGKSINSKSDLGNKMKTSEWKLEKNIQMYHFSMLTSELSEEDKIKNELIFVELFGEDSDEEDDDYSCPNFYFNSCVERISPWIVKYLMPYYHQHRIIGRNVFKRLGHNISKLIIKKVEYPNEKLVQHFVSKFFENGTSYTCERDIAEIKIDS